MNTVCLKINKTRTASTCSGLKFVCLAHPLPPAPTQDRATIPSKVVHSLFPVSRSLSAFLEDNAPSPVALIKHLLLNIYKFSHLISYTLKKKKTWLYPATEVTSKMKSKLNMEVHQDAASLSFSSFK